MWPFNSKKKEKTKDPKTYYNVDVRDVETLDQLKDIIRITHYTMTRKWDPEIRISDDRLEDFPSLVNIVTKVDNKNE